MNKKYIEDLKEIKEIMSRSSRFISLSGLSGISVGIIALIAAYLAHKIVLVGSDFLTFESVSLSAEQLMKQKSSSKKTGICRPREFFLTYQSHY